MPISNRDYFCPKCGGWMEGDGDIWYCDTCDYLKGEVMANKKSKKTKCNCECDCECK